MSKYATYNDACPRICVDIPEGAFEISCRTPNEQQITFSFCPTPSGDGHHCVDVQHHNRAAQDVIAFTKRGVRWPENEASEDDDDIIFVTIVLDRSHEEECDVHDEEPFLLWGRNHE